jgi:peptidoglycan endopeptidase LytF
MSRKDTILVAVLINMALLVIMFIGAVKPAGTMDSVHPKKGEVAHLVAKVQAVEEKKSSIDQVDQILSKYVETESKIETPEAQIELAEALSSIPLLEMKEVSESKRQYKEVIVKQGDVLEKIARNHHTTVDEVMRINKMSSTRLQIGQILYIPIHTASENIAAVGSNVMDGQAKYYVVKNGDNPWTIAIKNGIKVEELLRLNGINEEKAKKLKPGDRLRIK